MSNILDNESQRNAFSQKRRDFETTRHNNMYFFDFNENPSKVIERQLHLTDAKK